MGRKETKRLLGPSVRASSLVWLWPKSSLSGDFKIRALRGRFGNRTQRLPDLTRWSQGASSDEPASWRGGGCHLMGMGRFQEVSPQFCWQLSDSGLDGPQMALGAIMVTGQSLDIGIRQAWVWKINLLLARSWGSFLNPKASSSLTIQWRKISPSQPAFTTVSLYYLSRTRVVSETSIKAEWT